MSLKVMVALFQNVLRLAINKSYRVFFEDDNRTFNTEHDSLKLIIFFNSVDMLFVNLILILLIRVKNCQKVDDK